MSTIHSFFNTLWRFFFAIKKNVKKDFSKINFRLSYFWFTVQTLISETIWQMECNLQLLEGLIATPFRSLIIKWLFISLFLFAISTFMKNSMLFATKSYTMIGGTTNINGNILLVSTFCNTQKGCLTFWQLKPRKGLFRRKVISFQNHSYIYS